mmetsp:Transcript_23723/g.94082  ORF Transcript_23723/g.94082 Transcript_23723/m.94082 type:complete len:273 (-) Transcript_23723:64-882(-)
MASAARPTARSGRSGATPSSSAARCRRARRGRASRSPNSTRSIPTRATTGTTRNAACTPRAAASTTSSSRTATTSTRTRCSSPTPRRSPNRRSPWCATTRRIRGTRRVSTTISWRRTITRRSTGSSSSTSSTSTPKTKATSSTSTRSGPITRPPSTSTASAARSSGERYGEECAPTLLDALLENYGGGMLVSGFVDSHSSSERCEILPRDAGAATGRELWLGSAARSARSRGARFLFLMLRFSRRILPSKHVAGWENHLRRSSSMADTGAAR